MPWSRILTFILLPLGLGCAPSERPATYPRAPVIVISIDTLRADHLPSYGYKGVETPAIDAFRRDAVLFRKAYSHCPMTLPSHVSLLTGLLPHEHGVRNNLGYLFDSTRHTTLPGLLKQAGYATGAAVSAYVLRGSTGLADTFDSYDDSMIARANVSVGELSRPGLATAAVADRWIASHLPEPFFYFLHLFEPHTPYEPPEPFRSKYTNAYDGEIAAADAIVGRFLGSLKANGVYDRALIVLLSDHGEGLGDHGEAEHGVFLYREAIEVPLMVKLPNGDRGGSSVDSTVQLIDVFPTVASVLGLDAPQSLRGRSLFNLTEAVPLVYSESVLPRLHFGWSELRSLTDGRKHYIHAPRPELYDLTSDPQEKVNLIAEQRRVYSDMRQAMAPYLTDIAPPGNVAPEEAAKLAALGYVGAMRNETVNDLPDPKDRIGELELLKQGSRKEDAGDIQGAISIYQSLVEKNPRFTDAWLRLASAYERLGAAPKAEAAYTQAISGAPALAAGIALSLGNLQLRTRKLDRAEAHARLALEKSPGGAHLLLARIALARNDPASAEREARLAMNDTVRKQEAGVVLAQTWIVAGRLGEALELLDDIRRGLSASKETLLELESTRADALARMNRFAEAEAGFLAEISAFPQNRDAYTRLAILYVTQGRLNDAEAVLERMLKANPTKATALLGAETWAAVENAVAARRWRTRAAQLD